MIGPYVCDEVDGEPTIVELLAIEAEWPLIAAELAVVEAQCRFLGSPDVLTRRALRRAVTSLTRAYAEVYTPSAESPEPMSSSPQSSLCEGVEE